MNCPVCKVPLIVVERQQIELDYCLQCHGTWFDREEFALLILQQMGKRHSQTDQPIETDAQLQQINRLLEAQKDVDCDEPHYPCPRCNTLMTKIDISETGSLYLDRCPNFDGLWFEANETETALNYLINTHFSQGDGSLHLISHFVEETVYSD